MKRYVLRRDLPMFKAGTEFRLTKKGHLAADDRMVFHKNDLKKHPEILREWFLNMPEAICWERLAIKSELAKVLIAPEDYAEGDKKHFTFDEACAIEKKLNNGWRLPTRSEWALLCEEFGQEDGKLNPKVLKKNLKLGLNGADWHDGAGICLAGGRGYYWSSTPRTNGTYAYYLYFYGTTTVYPSDNSSRQFGFSVRLVKDLK